MPTQIRWTESQHQLWLPVDANSHKTLPYFRALESRIEEKFDGYIKRYTSCCTGVILHKWPYALSIFGPDNDEVRMKRWLLRIPSCYNSIQFKSIIEVVYTVACYDWQYSYECPLYCDIWINCSSVVIGNPYPDIKVLGANTGPIWGRQDPGGPMLAPSTLLSGYVYSKSSIDL